MAEDTALRPRWEYGIVGLQGDLVAALNQAGTDGWELVQLLPQPDQTIAALMKRHALAIITNLNGAIPVSRLRLEP